VCAACHGDAGQGGSGDPSKLGPAIAGQPAGYIKSQLLQFKANKRSPGDEALNKMKETIKNIPDGTLADVAAYYSSLR
jgi:cytochrome c553